MEVEDDVGRSIRLGEWIQRPDGYWVIRIKMPASISVVNGSVMTNAIAGGSCEQRGVFRRL